jgi:FAD/FMN-containing dehydrogenase
MTFSATAQPDDLTRFPDLGPGGLLLSAEDKARFEAGARYDHGKARFVARPRTTEEVSKVVAYCVEHKIPIIPQSGNTGLVGGSTPDGSGEQAVISLERLSAPIEINRQNRSVVVGAGVRLSQLNEALAPHGLFFPIDLGADPMIGGMVATNTGGARFVRYGDVRANLLGLEVVLADEAGTTLDMLDMPRKNNVGLDLKQLFVGTGGAYGVITRAALQVHPLPCQRATAFLHPRDDEAVIELLLEYERHMAEHLSAFEGVSNDALALALRNVPNLRNPFAAQEIPGYSVMVEVCRSWPHHENEKSLDDALTDVLEQIWNLPETPLANAVIASPAEAWAVRHALSHALADSGRVHGFDVGFDREVAMRFRLDARAEVGREFPRLLICDFGHIGDGGLHFNIVEPRDGNPLMSEAEVIRLKDLVYSVVLRHGGSFSAEHGIGRSNERWYESLVPAQQRDIAGAIGNILARGRIGAVPL